MGYMNASRITAVGISGSPSGRSKSRRLLEHSLALLAQRGAETSLVDLTTLPAGALLGREPSADVDRALGAVTSAAIVVVSTPIYRATYSGLLKVFFDLLAPEALVGTTAIAIATGGGPAHQLAIDYGLRPLLASVGALTVPTAVYGTDAAFDQAAPNASLLARLEKAAGEAIALVERIQPSAPAPSSVIPER